MTTGRPFVHVWRRAIADTPPPTEDDGGLSSTDRAVAHALALYASTDGGQVFPGDARLSRDTAMDRRTVKRARRRLEELGWLSIVERGGSRKGERRTATVYRLTLPTGGTAPPVPGAQDPQSTPTGGTRPPLLGALVHTTGGTGPPQGVLNVSRKGERDDRGHDTPSPLLDQVLAHLDHYDDAERTRIAQFIDHHDPDALADALTQIPPAQYWRHLRPALEAALTPASCPHCAGGLVDQYLDDNGDAVLVFCEQCPTGRDRTKARAQAAQPVGSRSS